MEAQAAAKSTAFTRCACCLPRTRIQRTDLVISIDQSSSPLHETVGIWKRQTNLSFNLSCFSFFPAATAAALRSRPCCALKFAGSTAFELYLITVSLIVRLFRSRKVACRNEAFRSRATLQSCAGNKSWPCRLHSVCYKEALPDDPPPDQIARALANFPLKRLFIRCIKTLAW